MSRNAQGCEKRADTARAMRRALLPATLLVSLLAGLPVAPAMARPTPKVKMVSPMRVKVGAQLIIRGKGFHKSKKRNTVMFRAPNGRTALAKPRKAGRRKLVVIVPGSVEPLLAKAAGRPGPTRFRLRVLSGKVGKYTAKRVSPLVLSGAGSGKADCDSDGSVNSADADDDNDLLPDSREAAIKTAPCQADTDGDGSEDGFEHESAIDLNQRALPYPGKRPFPNALDPSDGGDDHDGDGLSNKEEFGVWAKAAASPGGSLLQHYYSGPDAPVFGGPYDDRPRFGNHALPLTYSDGDQTSVLVRDGDAEYHWWLDRDDNGVLTDDERDADGDGLGNIEEIGLLMDESYYPAVDEDEGGKYCAYKYKPYRPRKFQKVDYLDWDTDGDGVWDGNDDQDNDDVSNIDEILPSGFAPAFTRCDEPKRERLPWGRTASPDPDGTPRRRNPYNPCLPYGSRTCGVYKPRT